MKKIIVTVVMCLALCTEAIGAPRIVIQTQNCCSEEVESYIELLPKEITDGYTGTIYVSDWIERKDEILAGIYFWESKDIIVRSDMPHVVVHELAHWTYFTTPWSKSSASLLYLAEKTYPALQSDDKSEPFACLVEDYYTGMLPTGLKKIVEDLLESIKKDRREK